MGILKIGRKLSGASSYCSQMSYPLNGKDTGMKHNPALGGDSGDDSDDCDLTEVNCELSMVEGQLCSIPYELYDLPDLREILSVDTWNSCLTEEERFFLSAYLPDMDQQTFMLTMKELLGGSDLYFGNPLDVVFRRLKGGFYPPKVARFRECLQFVQRRKHYQSLRSYHENMVQMFKDMRRVWDQCEMRAGVSERLYMWSKRRKHREFGLLDLNTVPRDGYVLSEVGNSDAMCQLSDRMKYVESKRANNVLPVHTPNCSAKGVLKVKTAKNCTFQNHSPKIVFSDMLEQCQSVPKGLLKVVPKVPLARSEQSNVVPRPVQPTSQVGAQASLLASVNSGDVGGLTELPSLWRKVGGSKVHTITELPRCVLNRQEGTLRSSRDTQCYTRKIKREKDPLLDGIADSGKHKLFGGDGGSTGRGFNGECYSPMDTMGARIYNFSGENLWKNLGTVNKEFSVRSFEQYPVGVQYYQGERHLQTIQEQHISVHPRVSEVLPIVSDLGTGAQETAMTSSSNQLNGQNDVSFWNSQKFLSKRSESEGMKDGHMLPLTYKRRKAQVKLNSLDFSKSLTARTDLEPGR